MPPVKTAKTPKSRRPARAGARLARQGRPAARGVRYLWKADRPTHVQLPISEYERLLDLLDAQQLVSRLEDPNTEWVKAEDAALEIAGSWLGAARKRAGLTQKQLAEKLRVPQSQISRLEKQPDRTTIRTMRRIAAALGVEVGALLSFASRR